MFYLNQKENVVIIAAIILAVGIIGAALILKNSKKSGDSNITKQSNSSQSLSSDANS